MPDLDSLSSAANLAHMTLRDHPHLNTPEAIASGPYGIEQEDASGIEGGLKELAAADPPLAEQMPGGGWRLVNRS